MSSKFACSLKWGKEKLALEINTGSSVEELKVLILGLTGVPTERQKLTCPKAWKGQLADGTDLASCKFKDGLTIMLIGTAETVAAQTKERVRAVDGDGARPRDARSDVHDHTVSP